MEWCSCWTVITSVAVELTRQTLAIACCFVFTTAGHAAGASCPRPAPRACAGCNGQAERPIGSDHGKTRFYNNFHHYCRSHGQIMKHPKEMALGAAPNHYVRENMYIRINAPGSIPAILQKFSRSLESPKFSRSLEKFGEFGEFGEKWIGPFDHRHTLHGPAGEQFQRC
jgi:hypothetical protein